MTKRPMNNARGGKMPDSHLADIVYHDRLGLIFYFVADDDLSVNVVNMHGKQFDGGETFLYAYMKGQDGARAALGYVIPTKQN